MQHQNYTTSFLVSQSPPDVFRAVTNPRAWWSVQIAGATDHADAVFSYHYQDVHRARMKIVTFVPDEQVEWQVLENFFNFTKDKAEWTDTTIRFEISTEGNKTRLTFTHIGLVPDYECFEICTDSWSNYINGSLRSLIETGTGQPNPYDQAIQQAATLKANNQ